MVISNRTIITNEDVKNIVNNIFNDKNNGFKINITNEETSKEVNIVDYLNFKFYNFRERLETDAEFGLDYENENDFFNNWVHSLNETMDQINALVQIVDSSPTVSQDIDSSEIMAKVTFLCPVNKFVNLEYYTAYLRNNFIGMPQEIINANNKRIKVFVLIGNLTYDDGSIIADTPMGECVVCELGIALNYLANAFTSYDYDVKIGVGGEFDSQGNLTEGVEMLTLPITKQTHQLVGNTMMYPMANKPQNTGGICTAFTRMMTFAFYDYSNGLSQTLDRLFWKLGSISADKETNISIALSVSVGGATYKYNCILKEMEKVIPNGDFTVSSLSLITKA